MARGSRSACNSEIRIDADVLSPSAAAFTHFNHQEVIPAFEVNLEGILEGVCVAASAIYGVCMNHFTVEPDLDRVITVDSHRNAALCFDGFNGNECVGGKIVQIRDVGHTY